MKNNYTVAIGDIHGSYDELGQLMEQVSKHVNPDTAKYIFLGDYVDRGPKSKEVIEYLKSLTEKDPERFIALKGNHDDMATDRSPGSYINWMMNGGFTTLESYGVSPDWPKTNSIITPEMFKQIKWVRYDYLAPEHHQWLNKLPLWHKDGLRTFVHAGIRRGVSMDKQTPEDLMWIRKDFLDDPSNVGGYIVHGHTVHSKPDIKHNRVGLDTGAVFGGTLTAGIFNDRKREPIAFVNHKGRYDEI